MSDLQIDWLAAAIFIVWPVYELLRPPPFTRSDEAYYRHLTAHSRIFPRDRMRWIFPIAWTALYIANGIGAYVYWHNVTLVAETTYSVGLGFYIAGTVLLFSWWNMFYRRRAMLAAFLVTFFLIFGSFVAYLVCAILLGPLVYPVIAASLMVAWLLYASMMTFVAAFWIPPFKEKGDNDNNNSSSGDMTIMPGADVTAPPPPPLREESMITNTAASSYAQQQFYHQPQQLSSPMQQYTGGFPPPPPMSAIQQQPRFPPGAGAVSVMAAKPMSTQQQQPLVIPSTQLNNQLSRRNVL